MKEDIKTVIRSQKRKKQKAIDAFGGKCCKCGYNKCNDALEFHHLNKDEKKESPAHIIIRWKWERVVKELEKCILVCANCHREIHAAERENVDLDLQRYVKPWYKHECKSCEKEFSTKDEDSIYCSWTCKQFGDRKVTRPTKDELSELIKTTNWTQLGKMFGVSDNSVRKWAKNYKIIPS